MISIIYGEKGTGKTSKIIANANTVASKGDIVFLSTTDRYRQEIKPQIKFVNCKDERVDNSQSLLGFIKGMLAANYDIEYIYIDGIYKMINATFDSDVMENFFLSLDEISTNGTVTFVLTVSCAKEKLPAYINRYIK